MNKKIPIVSILMLLFVISIAYFPSAKAENVEIVSDHGWLNAPTENSYLIVGEVENTGPKTVYEVRLSVILYSSNNEVLLESLTSTKLCAIQSGIKAPFIIGFFPDQTQVDQIHHYTIQIKSYSEQPFPAPARQISPDGLKFLSNSSYTDSKGYLHVEGEIQNIEMTTSNFTYVYATFYDSTGTVVSVQQAETNPKHIEARDTALFDIACRDTNLIPSITSYSLTAESNNYGLIYDDTSQLPIPIQLAATPSPTVPEFPPISVVYLFVLLPLIAIFVKKRSVKRL